MKRGHLFRLLGLASLLLALFAFPPSVDASTFVVNAADDVDDGACDDSHCSLREAIDAANANPGSDSITFDIPGPGPHVILMTDMLTISDDQTRIDGSSQSGYSGSPVIVLDGGNTICRGLWIASNDNVIVGLSFVRFNCTALSAAIHIWGGVLGGGENNRIEKNYIGVDASGTPGGNVYGVMLWDARNIIRGNVISGNVIGILSAAEKQIIEGNFIGTDPTGTGTSPGFMNDTGIMLQAGADSTRIGGADPSKRNLISGNNMGIDIESERNEISGNFIGTNLSGDTALPNLNGISVDGNFNLIGGPNPGEGNLISGNHGQALILGQNSNAVFGNMIGTDFSGTTDLPNFVGINVFGEENIIGGSAPGEGNVISGNEVGIWFPQPANDNSVIGNKIGTSVDGASAVGNNFGIKILWGAHDNAVGGLNPDEGNLIAFNTAEGIQIGYDSYDNPVHGNTIHTNGIGIWVHTDALRNSIRRNSIYGNTGLGIDLGTVGVNPNDPGDTDMGANALLNFPVITSAGTTGVSGTACAGCVVELFVSDQDPSGHGEGRTYIDAATADAGGNFTIPAFFPIASCTRVTATATDASGNTSEFSENQIIGFCLIFPWPWMILIPFGLIGLGAIGGRYAGRFTALSPRGSAVVGALIGAVLGAVLLTLAVLLPEVEIELPGGAQVYEPPMAICEDYLHPAGFSPSGGAVFEIGDDPLLEWSIMESLPEGQIRWRVDLIGPENLELSQTTSDTELLFSSFDVSPLPGRRYYWRVVGEIDGGEGAFEPFCTPGLWRSFQLGSLPQMEGHQELCLYTAIRSPICRASDYVEAEQIAVLQHGESAELVALNPELTHGKFELASMEQCWISLGVMEGPEDPVETCGVPIVDPEPKPAEMACSPDLDQEACEASGGEWAAGRVGAPSCICP
ncbi:MAG TPA: CSLREA domain-containing protein [Anaerolineae bacterium]|nr:CSLREA domain-containing protein [Anaerolineae bacterium]